MSHNDNRIHNVSVSLSDAEFKKYEQIQRQSGLKKTSFMRHMLTEGEVVSPLSIEEKTAINQMSKTARDLHRLLGTVYKEGLSNHVKWMEKIACEFETILQNLKKANQ